MAELSSLRKEKREGFDLGTVCPLAARGITNHLRFVKQQLKQRVRPTLKSLRHTLLEFLKNLSTPAAALAFLAV